MMRALARGRARLFLGAGLLGIVLVAGAAAVALARPPQHLPTTVEIDIHYSKFNPSQITVPVGVPITITLVNNDPIGHEWIVGDDAVQQIHRVGTELLHPDKPTELVIPAMSSRTTVVTFEQPGALKYICHLPGHEAYGMVGTVVIR
jgi:plastocyanin